MVSSLGPLIVYSGTAFGSVLSDSISSLTFALDSESLSLFLLFPRALVPEEGGAGEEGVCLEEGVEGRRGRLIFLFPFLPPCLGILEDTNANLSKAYSELSGRREC